MITGYTEYLSLTKKFTLKLLIIFNLKSAQVKKTCSFCISHSLASVNTVVKSISRMPSIVSSKVTNISAKIPKKPRISDWLTAA